MPEEQLRRHLAIVPEIRAVGLVALITQVGRRAFRISSTVDALPAHDQSPAVHSPAARGNLGTSTTTDPSGFRTVVSTTTPSTVPSM